MNSLNILSGFSGTPASTPPSTPPSRSRTGSSADPEGESKSDERDITTNPDRLSEKLDEKVPRAGRARTEDEADSANDAEIKQEAQEEDERAPLLSKHATEEQRSSWRLHRRLAEAIIDSAVTVVRVVYTALSAPKRWVVACFYNEQGQFSAFMPFRQFRALMGGKRSRKREQPMPAAGDDEIRVSADKRSASASQRSLEKDTLATPKTQHRRSPRRSPSNSSISSATTTDMTSEGELETDADKPSDSPSRNTRSRTPTVKDEINPQKKSIRIKLHAPTDTQRQHRHRPQSPASATSELAQSLKSPIAPPMSQHLKTLTRYPRLPTPPRPLVPRRQPSYSLLAPSPTDQPRKTLVIDLDETLIHSMAKGGRMSQGHMVEVRLTQPTANPVTSIIGSSSVSSNSTTTIPILYYVHERPYVHDFLRKVAKWYNLVIFTASVQEYADPVIDYLERERKYFSARYYRQHCTWRAGAYVKDLGVVEGDLGRVLILDNSPMSYVFHEDNALPIEGWISDPTDRELLHLIALLEGLQYATDVRAILALRQGMLGTSQGTGTGFAAQA
ncbi:Nuclear envelope morphology protein 1 [Oleoguttula sp. CCFEE 5521]